MRQLALSYFLGMEGVYAQKKKSVPNFYNGGVQGHVEFCHWGTAGHDG